MTGPSTNPGRWAIVRGLAAFHLGRPRDHNPEPKGSSAARCWDYGHQVIGRRRGRSRNRPDPWNATRETSCAGLAGGGAASKARSGRGRARVGDRGEWSEADLALLIYCTLGEGPVETRDLAVLLGRSEQAVRGQRARLRKAGALRGRRSDRAGVAGRAAPDKGHADAG